MPENVVSFLDNSNRQDAQWNKRNKTMTEKKPLTLKVKLGFGVCDLGGNLFFTLIGFYLLNYLTDHVMLSAGLAGTALMIGKIWDAVTDPAVGYLSDRTTSKWGRRRPYIFAGSFALFISMILMFTNPHIEKQYVLFIYIAVIFCFLNTAYTLVNIPYSALTPELTDDYNERTVLNGFRMSFAVVGTLIGAALVLPIVGMTGNPDLGWTIMGGIMGAIMMVTALITFIAVKEPGAPPVKENIKIIASYMSALKLKPFITALIPWALHITGVTIIQGALIYYFRYIYKDEGSFPIALLILLVSSLIFIPVWVKVSKKIGKKASYNIGMLIFAVAVLAFFFLGIPYGVKMAFIIMAVGGIGFATQYVMPYSILPDIVEFDYAERGVRREGVFYGLWTFISKLGQAFALAFSGWILGAFGYVAEAEQTSRAVLGIRLLTGPVPAAFFIAGVIVLSFYPITREYYAEIMEKVKQRDGDNK
jgi:glycoside/pentoside/hexuronide:cation symporter, GPH family